MRLLATVALAALLLPAVTAADPEPALPPAPICHSPGDTGAATSTPAAEQILSGYGSGGFLVRTHNPQAQAFFDNGMQLGHAFAHKASIAAFKEARRLDPDCAMCAWGEAWASGPTINYPVDKKAQKELAAIADRAAELARGGPDKEVRLTAALQKRYRHGGGTGAGDDAYARAMDEIARAYPDDNELAVLAADAWMVPAAGRNSQANLPRAVELLEGSLRRNPHDTGAIHFYIHATEMSGFGEKALPYAQKLQGLAPSASHLVHMPSHTFYRVGWYRQAAQSNLDAVQIDQANARRLNTEVWKLSYHGHNVQFGSGAALMDGDGAAALSLARPVLARLAELKPDNGWGQFGAGTAYFAYGRYADPAVMAALADPGARLPYLQAMWRYARGEAAARRGDVAGLRQEAAQVRVDGRTLRAFGDARAQAGALVDVTRLVLEGRLAMLERRYGDAARAYRKAAEVQEGKLGGISDPPAFWYPVRRSLASALLADGKAQAAATEAEASLSRWRGDPLALVVLARAEQGMGRGEAARQHLADAGRAFAGDPAAVAAPLV